MSARRAPDAGHKTERCCGECRKPIRPACQCEDILRICEEQQRAQRAEALLEYLGHKSCDLCGLWHIEGCNQA